MAFGMPTTYQPLTQATLAGLLSPFAGASIGRSYFGPFGIGEDGLAWLVIVTQDKQRPRRVREAGRMGLMGWRWDVAPSCPFTFTLMGNKEPRPHARWIVASADPVMVSIRKYGRFHVCIAHPAGGTSGWFEAGFTDGSAPISTLALEEQWQTRGPGIPRSRIGQRYRPFDADDEDQENQIRLWSDVTADSWRALGGRGPWSDDLELADEKTADWASNFFHKRCSAAGSIQLIIERQEIDGTASLVDAQGRWVADHADCEKLDLVMQQYPILRHWVTAIAGPAPDAHTAHEAAVTLLQDSNAIFAFTAYFFGSLNGLDDPVFAQAIQFSCEAALLDTRLTKLGSERPWLKNVGESRLELCTIRLDPTCPRADLETLWRSGLQFVDLLDAGLWFGPKDLPAPLVAVNEALSSVRLEGTVEESHIRIMQLLREAQEARQWSIPWGARVQVQFGPFRSMRIFEKDGEFSCHFLDERDRYLHVAIGLGHPNPQVSSVHLIRHPADGGDPVWNDDAAVSLQLIAAAIVRDFLVVEERASVFSSKRVRGRGTNAAATNIIYLPRVHYNRMLAAPEAAGGPGLPLRARHAVTHHLRRAGSASASQRFLAQRFGIALPGGFTFVRAHQRGAEAQERRVVVYRSRSASRMIFEEVAVAPEGTRPAWFEFEKACAQLLADDGMKVIHQAALRDGDGGVDLFAVDLDGNSWVVQCKCWSQHRRIGPDVIRELVGAIAQADRGSERTSRGMIITTTTFTSSAVSEALANSFRLIDGALFDKRVQKR